jgi:hypothetical protein
VEAVGVEPASEKLSTESIHAFSVRICLVVNACNGRRRIHHQPD